MSRGDRFQHIELLTEEEKSQIRQNFINFRRSKSVDEMVSLFQVELSLWENLLEKLDAEVREASHAINPEKTPSKKNTNVNPKMLEDTQKIIRESSERYGEIKILADQARAEILQKPLLVLSRTPLQQKRFNDILGTLATRNPIINNSDMDTAMEGDNIVLVKTLMKLHKLSPNVAKVKPLLRNEFSDSIKMRDLKRVEFCLKLGEEFADNLALKRVLWDEFYYSIRKQDLGAVKFCLELGLRLDPDKFALKQVLGNQFSNSIRTQNLGSIEFCLELGLRLDPENLHLKKVLRDEFSYSIKTQNLDSIEFCLKIGARFDPENLALKQVLGDEFSYSIRNRDLGAMKFCLKLGARFDPENLALKQVLGDEFFDSIRTQNLGLIKFCLELLDRTLTEKDYDITLLITQSLQLFITKILSLDIHTPLQISIIENITKHFIKFHSNLFNIIPLNSVKELSAIAAHKSETYRGHEVIKDSSTGQRSVPTLSIPQLLPDVVIEPMKNLEATSITTIRSLHIVASKALKDLKELGIKFSTLPIEEVEAAPAHLIELHQEQHLDPEHHLGQEFLAQQAELENAHRLDAAIALSFAHQEEADTKLAILSSVETKLTEKQKKDEELQKQDTKAASVIQSLVRAAEVKKKTGERKLEKREAKEEPTASPEPRKSEVKGNVVDVEHNDKSDDGSKKGGRA